ncbi:MAG: glycine cleavage system aminomethyltransferase GcvT [Candidatus Eremiobacteraeota bacterium]|nr:glycine cleavage system aminomethyltransferase GcvT [Candidatus Eremiobacteraeota bacterium]
MSTVQDPLRRTALYDAHKRLGARLVPFGGFEMPVQYSSILKEHNAVRERAGLFDLSHMGQFLLEGENVGGWADALTVNAVSSMKPFQARYNIFCNDNGGAHDDVIFYRLPDRWLLIVNASNAQKMWDHLNAHVSSSGIKLTNLHGTNSLIAIQGPKSASMLSPAVDANLSGMKYYSCTHASVYGYPAIVARTGYTGEDGFELFVQSDCAVAIWDKLLSEKEVDGLEPAGLGARDVLRLEAGMPLYGHEMDEEITPIQAGLDWAVKFSKPQFIGKDALQRQKVADTYRRVAGLILPGRAPAREGYPVIFDGRSVGEIRSGSLGPSVGNRNIATALVEKDAANTGQTVRVEIRGTAYDAHVVPLPFYKRR